MIRKTIKGGDFKSQMVGELVFDQVPEEGSFNPVTSDAVAKIAGGVADLDAIVPEGASEENKLATAADVAGVQEDVDTIEGKIPSDTSTTNKLVNESGLQDAIDNASESWSTGFTPKGESSVSDLNDLATQSNGDSYIVTDSGTLTDGSLAVVAGDQVAWDSTNSVWYKLPQYALFSEGVVKKSTDATDLNDIVNPGMYSVMASYSNYPTGANNGMLTVFNISANRKLQLLSESEPNTTSPSKLWYRCSEYGSNTWASWTRVKTFGDNPSIYSDISQNTDFNSLVDAGYYTLGGGYTYTNKPSSFSYGFLIVTANTSIGSRRAQQLLFSQNNNAIYTRKLVSGTWSDWEEVITQSVLDTTLSNSMLYHNLSVDTDLDSVDTSGYYLLSSSNTYAHAPENFEYGFAVVYSNNTGSASKRLVQIVYDQKNSIVYMRNYVLSNWSAWQQLNGDAGCHCSIRYDSTNKWKIIFGDFIVDLVYKEISNKHQANYNLDKITDLAGNTLCPEGTDIIGPAHIDGESDFIGGVHGYETTTSIKIICDGVEKTLDSDLDETAKVITILMQTSDISHVSLEEVWTRDIAITITSNEILVSSQYNITSASDITITRMTNGGLMAAYHSIIGSAWMPAKALCPIPSGAPGTLGESSKNTVAVFNTTRGTVKVENIIGHELPTYKGWWQNFYNEQVPRLKSYFDIIKSSTVVHNGDVFIGSAKYTFTPVNA